MAVNSVRVIVSTFAVDLTDLIQRGLSNNNFIEMIINVTTAMDAENKLSRDCNNVVVLDLDSAAPPPVLLQQMANKPNVLVILTSMSDAKASAYLYGKVRDFIPKPGLSVGLNQSKFINMLSSRIELLVRGSQPLGFNDMMKTVGPTSKIVAIGSSTGGTEALEKLMRSWTENIPPILIVQHMPSGFTRLFADRLNNIYKMEVKEAASGDYLKRGQILLAPADYHMTLAVKNGKLCVECFKGTKVHGVMPSADVLFESVASIMRRNALGVILTGMGADGAKGLLLMHMNGARTIGQNKETCVVYGMPKAAKDLGAVDAELPLERIAEEIRCFQ